MLHAKQRLTFVDLLRGWAGIVMVEVHVFNAFVVPEIREEGWFKVLNFINGLVAPTFLFVAGFIFLVTSRRKLDDFRTFGPAFWKQLNRIALIWVIGYGLHLPFFSLTRTIHETTGAGWLMFYQVDILHCIALGMLFIFLTRVFVKSDRAYERVLLWGGLGVVLAAPLVADLDLIYSIPPALAGYINGQHYSQFPALPWLGFLLLGGYCGAIYMRWKDEGREREYFTRLPYLALGFYGAGSLLIELPFRIPHVSTAIRSNPLFFSTRFGVVLLLMLICWYYAERRTIQRSFVLDVSRESLFVYAAHLLIIYARYIDDRSPASLYGGSWNVLECTAATVGLIAFMAVAARVWGWIKQRSMPSARAISYATGIVALILFIVRKV